MKNSEYDTSESSAATVVVVNDDIVQLSVLDKLLCKQGYRTQSFQRAGIALLEMVPAPPPDIIVTDLHMPEIDGWRFCRLLRSPEYEAFNNVPILVVSATFAGDEASRITADLGANAFLSSPVDSIQFFEQVKKLIDGNQQMNHSRVLVVDDSSTMTVLLKTVFDKNGYITKTVPTVQEAINAFEKVSYDIAILDYHLADQKGDELLEPFLHSNPDCVCIMMTTDPSPELALRWMRKGAAAYLRKPFDPEYLIELCAKACRERALLRGENLLEQRTRELRERNAQYLSIFHGSPDAILVHDASGIVLDANKTMTQRLSIPLETFKGRKLSEFVTPNNAADISDNAAVTLGGKPQIFETTYISTSGTNIPVEVHEQRIQWRNTEAILSISRDITDRKQAEEALIREKLFSDAAITSLPGIFYVYDEHGKMLRWNRNLETVSGYSGDEISRMLPAQFFPPDEQANVKETIREVFAKGWASVEALFMRKDNSTILHFLTGARFDMNGRPCLVGVGFDISKRRRAEEEKAELEKQLRRAQKLETIGTMAGGIAHDFNNILAPIMGYTDMAMLNLKKSDPLYEDLEHVLEGTYRAKDLVEQILQFSKQIEKEQRPLSLQMLVTEVLKLLRPSIPTTVEIRQRIDTSCGKVCADATQIHQVIVNLCTNAWHAMEEQGGTLSIHLSQKKMDTATARLHPGLNEAEYACLSIIDTGSGMDEETLERIFEPFFTTKTVDKGTGLGLSVVHGIVRSHKGDISVYSEPEKGSAFHVYLPIIVTGQDIAKTEDKQIVGGTESVMIVDDEPAIAEMVKTMLEKLGYTAHVYNTGLAAIEAFSQEPDKYDLLISDLTMPQMTGLDVADEMHSKKSRFPVVIMTGFGDSLTMPTLERYGIAEVIGKPISLRDLATAIRKILEK